MDTLHVSRKQMQKLLELDELGVFSIADLPEDIRVHPQLTAQNDSSEANVIRIVCNNNKPLWIYTDGSSRFGN